MAHPTCSLVLKGFQHFSDKVAASAFIALDMVQEVDQASKKKPFVTESAAGTTHKEGLLKCKGREDS